MVANLQHKLFARRSTLADLVTKGGFRPPSAASSLIGCSASVAVVPMERHRLYGYRLLPMPSGLRDLQWSGVGVLLLESLKEFNYWFIPTFSKSIDGKGQPLRKTGCFAGHRLPELRFAVHH